MTHTLECIALTVRLDAARAEYAATWPNHCPTCEGWGTVGSGATDWHDGSVDIEPCSTCGDNDLCPRCGKRTFDWGGDGGPVCAACDFNFDAPDGMPGAESDCGCWYRPENNPTRDEIRRALQGD